MRHGLKNKKGVLYTIIAITLILAIVFATSLSYQYRYREQRAIIETRVNTMDNFAKDLGDDIEKGIRTASYRAIVGMTNYVVDTISFIDDSQQRFQELFYYGTLYGNESSVMNNNSFIDWIQKMTDEADKIGLDVEFSLISFDMGHTSPWEVQVDANVSVFVEDARGTATWKSYYDVTALINIEGFEDPLYAIMTGNGVTKSINRTIYDEDYVSGNDTSNLERHMNLSYYTDFEGSPSFLMRFEGDFNASEYGIESLVDKQEVGTYYPCAEGTSNVDTIYWQCGTNTTWQVDGMPSWFYIDNLTDGSQGRLEKYEVEDVLT